jgi:ankyrin repeat protein
LLKDNPDLIDSKDNQSYILGGTALHYAVGNMHKEVAEFLLAHKADVNAKDTNGWTPLHWAAEGNKNDFITLLLANKADVNARSMKGPEPVYVGDAGLSDKGAITVKMRQTNKADENTRALSEWTPLLIAALEGYTDTTKLLLAEKADVNAKTSNGWTPLHWAVSKGNKDVADLLRQHGVHE